MKKTTKISALTMAVLMGVSLCGCGTQAKEPQKTVDKVEKTTTPKADATAEEKEVFTKGVNDFSYELFEKLAQGENVVVSPYSVSMALSMADVGAGGETKKELEQVLGIKELNSWNNSVRWYMDRDFGEQTKVLTANSLWLDHTVALVENAKDDFLKILTEDYRADVEQRDLHTDATREAVNQWAAEHTENMIPKLYDRNIEAQIILINAIYFEGKWETPFDKEDTYQQKFYGANKTTKVDMMHQYNEAYAYAECGELQAIELPYKDDTVVMDVIMRKPATCGTGRLSTLEYWNALTKKEKENMFATLSEGNWETFSEIAIPRFEMEWEQSMVKELKQMGINSMFAENADFSKSFLGSGMDDVFQKAKIIVEETGTKAAAVTVIEKANCAMVEEEKKFIAEEPFLFVIRDAENGTILFMGDMEEL